MRCIIALVAAVLLCAVQETPSSAWNDGGYMLGADNDNAGDWIAESVAISKTAVYRDAAGVKLGDPVARLTLDYLGQGSWHRQTACAARRHRLASLINKALGH